MRQRGGGARVVARAAPRAAPEEAGVAGRGISPSSLEIEPGGATDHCGAARSASSGKRQRHRCVSADQPGWIEVAAEPWRAVT
jgi:hypothetical protein